MIQRRRNQFSHPLRSLLRQRPYRRELLEEPHGRSKSLNHLKEFLPQVWCFENIKRLAKRIVGNNIDRDCPKSMMHINRLPLLLCFSCPTNQLIHLVLDNLFEVEHPLAREQGIQRCAANRMDLVGRGSEGGVRKAEVVVKFGAFRVLRSYVIDFVIVLWIAEMDFVGRDSDDWACEQSRTSVHDTSTPTARMKSEPYILCSLSILS